MAYTPLYNYVFYLAIANHQFSFSRIPNESEPLPDELKIPIGIAEDLLLPVLSIASGPNIQGPVRGAEDNDIDDETTNSKRRGTDTTISVRI